MKQLQKKYKITTVPIQKTPLQDKSLREILLSHMKKQQNPLHYSNNQTSPNNQLYNLTGNSFFDAFYAAYCLHGDVIISANDIWIVISHYFSQQINEDPEKYRDLFVDHEGKKQLIIELDSRKPDWQNFPSQKNNWGKAIEQFNELIQVNTKGNIALLMKSDFSCSTQIEQVSANICIMSQMKAYFEYRMNVCGCGIQNVHFIGGVEDFEYLVYKIKSLAKEYSLNADFNEYLTNVLKIVDTFIEHMKNPNNVDVKFWNNIFDETKGKVSGLSGRLIDKQLFKGWIKEFFGLNQIQKDKVPSFQSTAPVIAKDQDNQKTYNLDFFTEFQGIEEIQDRTFKPVIGVQIKIEKDKNEESLNYDEDNGIFNDNNQKNISSLDKKKNKSSCKCYS